MALVLSRREKQAIVVRHKGGGSVLRITYMGMNGRQAILAFEGSRDFEIDRAEIDRAKHQEERPRAPGESHGADRGTAEASG